MFMHEFLFLIDKTLQYASYSELGLTDKGYVQTMFDWKIF